MTTTARVILIEAAIEVEVVAEEEEDYRIVVVVEAIMEATTRSTMAVPIEVVAEDITINLTVSADMTIEAEAVHILRMKNEKRGNLLNLWKIDKEVSSMMKMMVVDS